MAINYEQDEQGIVTLTMDMNGRSANVLNEQFFAALEETLHKLAIDGSVMGVILTSGKKLFMAGADIDTMFASNDPQVHFDGSQAIKVLFRRLETLGK
ncbi:MAG: enoyl-CoA hydratase/isomerase family protein, partial [Anaerolineales bacterium]|nr:enoyl-CoA hydratase/isomerase family protein [Anaerolineales bacterium]